MGVNPGKVFFIILMIVVPALIYGLTRPESVQAISFWINEALSQKKKTREERPREEKRKPEINLVIQRPNLKPGLRLALHYKLYDKADLVTRAETVHWKIASMDDSQITWESENHLIESYTRNIFLPPMAASVTPFQPTKRLDYLTPAHVFPLSMREPRAVRIQNRSVNDSQPYEWSCLVSGQEELQVMAGEFAVAVITCMARGGQEGVETYKYSEKLGHWVWRERRGFDQPRLTVELVEYAEE